MSLTRQLAKKLWESKGSAGGNWFRDGKYKDLVSSLLLEQKQGGLCFIAEHYVVEATAVFDDVEPNKAGTTASYVVNFDGAGKLSAADNVKSYLIGLCGPTIMQMNEEQFASFMDLMVSKAQPARGMVAMHETFRKFSRSGKNS